MFTGIIESLGKVTDVRNDGENKHFYIESKLTNELKIDQSVAHNGVCLTVVGIQDQVYQVTAIKETLLKSALASQLKKGQPVNLERCMKMNGRLDGHMVYGHVDSIGRLKEKVEKSGSWELTISFSEDFGKLIIEKGSISLNGASLTVFDVTPNTFKVAIIPYTYNNTIIQNMKVGDDVNLEFDVIGKYILKNLTS